MEQYIVSARKYRPSTFSTVIGQKPLTAALKHAIATNRLAHAYLFCGSRGVGKTSCARIFAKTINCEHRTPEGEACNECESCRSFNEGNSLNIIELDAASHNGVDDMKSLIEQVQVVPTRGRYRVFIIDEVHMLSNQAFNAFLKTLEEPPEYVVFVLATTEKHKIIPTILSRCQIYDFSRISINDMIDHLASVAANEGISAEKAALNIIARKADGAMRDALSIFDQVAASSMGNITYKHTIENLNILDSGYYGRIVDAALRGDVAEALIVYKEVREKGFDSQFFINGLGLYFRDLMLAMNDRTINILETSDEEKAQMHEVAVRCRPEFIYKAMALCNDADLNFRIATNKQFLIELTLVKLCQLETASEPAQGTNLKPLPKAAPAPAPSPSTAPAPAPVAAQAPAPVPGRPAPVVPPATAHAAASAPRAVPRMPSINPGARREEKEEGPKEPDTSDEHHPAQNKPYTEDDLKKLWMDFPEKYPEERILYSTMKTSLPARHDGDTFIIAVEDNIQIDILARFMPEIRNHIRSGLDNSSIDFLTVVSAKESTPAMWTERVVLQHMVEKKEALKDLITGFSLSLA